MSSFFRARVTATLTGAAALVLGGSMAAWAAGPGVGDVSDAMRYGASAPIGAIVGDLSGADDSVSTVAAPFALNFFGSVYNGICITTNGGIYPVATSGDSCSNEYDIDVENLALSSSAPMIAALAADVDPGNCSDNSDDGFGVACEIYFGSTTVDGRDAFVVTWYRVSMNDSTNDPTLSSTFQVVIIKRATGSDVAGWDFDIEFNYGQVKDAEDGYSAASPSGACDSSSDLPDCRWGVGWADYDSVGGTADPYELFPNTQVTDLADGGATSLTANSLNSAVPGRYTFSMVGGVTVGFAAPVMDGSGPAAAAPVGGAGPSLADTGANPWLATLAAVFVLIGVGLLVTRPRADRA